MVFALCLSHLTLLVLVGVLYRDRQHWISRHEARDAEARADLRARDTEAREREAHLFDQLLRAKGFRATSEPLTPQMPIGGNRITASPEDISVLQDRIAERTELGLLTAGEGLQLLQDMAYGKKTLAEVDRVLWQRQIDSFAGSVADIQ